MNPSELPTIMEGDDYEPPIIANDERHSYLHLDGDKNDNCVAKLVSQFNKSMDRLNLTEEGGQVSPTKLQAKSMEAVCFPEKSRKCPLPKLHAKSLEVLSPAENDTSKSPKPKIPQKLKLNLYKSLNQFRF